MPQATGARAPLPREIRLLSLFLGALRVDYFCTVRPHERRYRKSRAASGCGPLSQRGRHMADTSDNKELKNALSQIEKTFGPGSIMNMGEVLAASADVQGISTDALS